MNRNTWLVLGFVCSTLGAVGCSSAGSGGSPAGGGAGGSGASGGGAGTGSGGGSGGDVGGTGGVSSGGAAGSGGTAGGPPAYVSNTPSAKVAQVPSADADGLIVVSSNLTDEASGSQYFQKWTGLLYNGGAKVVCYAKVNAKFFNLGSEVASHLGFADTPPHMLPNSVLPASCLQPGSIGAIYSNGFSNTPLSTITDVSFDIDGLAYDSVPLHPSSPTISGVTLAEVYGAGTGYWAATGSLTATNTIYNVGITVFPVGADGLIPDRLSDTHLDTLAAGSSFAFETSTYQGVPATAQLLSYSEFIDGAKGSAAMPPTPNAEGEDPAQLQASVDAAVTPEQRHAVARRVRAHQASSLLRFKASK